MRFPAFILSSSILGGLLCPASSDAQIIELRLLQDSSSIRVSGAIVRILSTGRSTVAGLTNELGLLTITPPGPGTYRLKIDRIGWTGIVTEPLELRAGQVLKHDVRMSSRRILLPPVMVRGRAKCETNPQEGTLASLLWTEVQKALTANVLTQRGKAVPLHLREFVREVDLDLSLIREWVVTSRITRGAPFASLPAADLMSAGFVQENGDSTLFAAPDATTILTDEFVTAHCFQALPDSANLVGLAFHPVPGRRVSDVSGTLWLERETSELRFLAYSYTGLEQVVAGAHLGGRVEFSRLPGGQWIVTYWYVRMPRLITGQMNRLVGYLDRGGRVEIAGDTMGIVHRAIVRGMVWDSTLNHGLARAFVRVADTPDSIMTDSEGQFEMAVEAAGDQVITASHPKLGLLGEPTSQRALLSLGDTTRVNFAVPPISRFVHQLCSKSPDERAIVGLTWDSGGKRSSSRTIRVFRPSVRGNVPMASPFGATTSRQTRSSAQGLYGVCHLPPTGEIRIAVNDSTGVLLETPVLLDGQSHWIELREWGSRDTVVARLGLIPPPLSATLTGLVRDDSNKTGLPGIEVLLEGTENRAVTDSAGRFILEDLPLGQHVALLRAIGWRPQRITVDLVSGETATIQARMVAEGVPLDPITVVAAPKQPRGSGFEAFDERRRMGFGRFLDSTDLRRVSDGQLGDLLESMPGLIVARPPMCSRGRPTDCVSDRTMRVATSGRMLGSRCLMQVVVDGLLVAPGGAIRWENAFDLNTLRAHELLAVEVYRSAGEIPPEFNDTRAACGVLVIWTKR